MKKKSRSGKFRCGFPLWIKLEYDGKKRRHSSKMPSKSAGSSIKVTAENAVIQKISKIMTAKSAVKSQKWRQIMPSYIKSDGKICRHFTLSGVSGAFSLTRGILAVTSQMCIWQETPSIRRKPKRISHAIPRASRYKEIPQPILQ